MLSYNEIRPKKYIVIDREPYEVLSSQITKKQRQKPSNQTRLKNVRTGKVTERAFHQSEGVEEASLEKKEVKHLYKNNNEYWFCDTDNPRNRFSISGERIDGGQFLKENENVEILLFEEEILTVKIPIKIDLEVVSSPPNIRGNTTQGGTKQVVLEGGASVSVPLFIEEGDIVRVNTETGLYAERVQKTN
jgi:elongation factor P